VLHTLGTSSSKTSSYCLKAVLLLALALVAVVISVVVVVLVERVKHLPLGVVDDEVGGVATLEAAPRRPPHLLAKSHHRGCSRTARQKLHTRRTKQTLKQMSQ
jgi:hypothetical protein